MGFFDSLFGKKKMTLDEAHQVNQAYNAQNPVPASNEQALLREATSSMTGRKFQQAIDLYTRLAEEFPGRKGMYLSQIGVGHYFLGDYAKAIDYYVQAREHGEDRSMMDDNIWEACEAIYKQSKDLAAVERYHELCPGGSHARAANRLLGR